MSKGILVTQLSTLKINKMHSRMKKRTKEGRKEGSKEEKEREKIPVSWKLII